MTKNKKIIDAEVVAKKEATLVEKVDLTEAAAALAKIQAAPNAEDLLFVGMSKESRTKYGVSLNTQQLEERHTSALGLMNENRIEYALSCTRLVARQAWREPQADGNPCSRIDYFEGKLGDSYNTVDRHVKAVWCLVAMGKDPSKLNEYKYRRLAAFYDKIEKGVATKDDYIALEPRMIENPPAGYVTNDKEWENELKQRFGAREAEMKALEAGEEKATVKVSFEIPVEHKHMVDQAERLGLELAKKEGRNPPSLGSVVIEALAAWHLKMGHDMKFISAEYARQALQEVYKIALIPFRIHKFQQTEGLQGMPTMRVFRVGDYFVLEEEPRHAAKALNVKVDQLQEVRVNVAAYLTRTGVMQTTDEEVKKAQEVLEKPLEAKNDPKVEPKAKKQPKAKSAAPKAIVAEATAATEEPPKKKRGRPHKNPEPEAVEDPKPEPKKSKAEKKPKAEPAANVEPAAKAKTKKKLSEMTANEISLHITKVRQKLNMSDEDYKAMSEGRDPKQVLRDLIELQKASV